MPRRNQIPSLIPVYNKATGEAKHVHRVDAWDYLANGWQLTPVGSSEPEPELEVPAPSRNRARKLQAVLEEDAG